MTHQVFEKIQAAVQSGSFSKITFSLPADPQTLRMSAKPFDRKGEIWIQFERLCRDGKALHENLPAPQAAQRVLELLDGSAYRQINVIGAGECAIKYSKKGKLLVQDHLRAQSPAAAPAAHDREKDYFFRDGQFEPFLYALGITDREGGVFDKKRSKFRQINRFLQLLAEVYPQLPQSGTLRVCDLCCGKSYLTFAVYTYLTKIMGREVEMCGMDLKQDVIAFCQKTADALQCRGMHFVCGDIGNYTPAQPPHLIIFLHACDTATDLVLYHATRLGAKVILSTPCCHHEMFHQLNAGPCDSALSPILEHSMLAQKLADCATDALRVKWLEYMGYKVSVLELIDPEETPKNLMIRAIKSAAPDPKKQEAAKRAYDALCAFLNVEPYLKKLTGFPNEQLKTEENE